MVPDLLLLQYCLLRLGMGRMLALAVDVFALRTFFPRLSASAALDLSTSGLPCC